MNITEKHAVIFTGIQASGKTTFYNEYFGSYVHINLDTLHTRSSEKRLLEECLGRGSSFVIDNTDPTRESRSRYITQAAANGYRIIGYYFRSAISECITRNEQRSGKAHIPAAAIANTYNKLELPSYDEGFDELYYVRIEGERFVIEKWDETKTGGAV